MIYPGARLTGGSEEIAHYLVGRPGTVTLDSLTCPIPPDLRYEEAAVLPLALSTAACGLFQQQQLALGHPSLQPQPTGQSLLIWGGASSVGSNAIQLAVAAGYEVITTASPHNFDYVRALGASQVYDYHKKTVVQDLVTGLDGKTLAGALSVAAGSAEACIDVIGACKGRKFVSMASTPVSFGPLAVKRRSALLLPRLVGQMLLGTVRLQLKAARLGVRTRNIWGSSLMNDEVGPLIFKDFLPAALAQNRYVAAPPAQVAGHGLGALQRAFELQRGVSARKIVVPLK